jgi:hypothetical protein
LEVKRISLNSHVAKITNGGQRFPRLGFSEAGQTAIILRQATVEMLPQAGWMKA